MSTSLLRPGVVVTSQQQPNPRGTAVNTGTWFVVGAAEKGSLTSAQLIRNMNEFSLYYGSRKSYSMLWDSLETYFREGGVQAYVARVAGASVATASVTLNDSVPTASIKVSAKNPGIWGNSLLAAVIAATGGYQIVVSHSSLGIIETSPVLTSQADAVSWSINSIWITVSIPGGAGTANPAVVSATALTGGVDDNTSGVTDSVRNAGLALFINELGTGQVSIPGSTTTSNRNALVAHAQAYNREALLDSTNTGVTATLLSEATGLQSNEYAALFGPWVLVPGINASPTTPRTVPPCAVAAALMSRNDPIYGVNTAAAGFRRGTTNFAIGLTQANFSDVDRDSLNTAGLNLFRSINGDVILFGNRSLAPIGSVWIWLANQRLRLQLTQEGNDILQGFLFDQLDGANLTLGAVNGALAGMCNRHYLENELYGPTPRDAYSVDTGPSLNTPTTLANDELHAVIGFRASPGVELATITLTAVSVAQSL